MSQITVLMTVYNGMPYLTEAVASVRGQTVSDWKMVIVDDGSTDGSGAWLDALDDPRIQVIHQANAGAPAAANRGLEACDTEFVARLDADDVAHPRRLEAQRDFLVAHPEVGLLGTQAAPLGITRSGSGSSLPLDHGPIVAALMQGRYGICHSSVMVRTKLLKDIGGYWDRGRAEDYDMFLRIADRAELANLPELRLHFRILESGLHSSGMSETRARIAYAAESARRRHRQLAPIAFEEYCRLRGSDPWWKRTADQLEVYALGQYRRAQREILGIYPAVGYGRLAWAVACGPRLTWLQISRRVRNRWCRSRRVSPANAALVGEAQ